MGDQDGQQQPEFGAAEFDWRAGSVDGQRAQHADGERHRSTAPAGRARPRIQPSRHVGRIALQFGVSELQWIRKATTFTMASADRSRSARRPLRGRTSQGDDMNKRHWRLLAAPALALAPAAVGWQAASASTAPPTTTPSSEMMGTDAPHQHVAYRDAELEWGPAPPVFPAGAQMAVLSGDPSAEGGLFTVRLLMPDGYIIPPHWHPTDENVTVIHGEFLVGLGDTFDEAALLPALQGPGRLHHRPGQRQPLRHGEGRDGGPGPRHRAVRDDLRQPGRRSPEPVTIINNTIERNGSHAVREREGDQGRVHPRPEAGDDLEADRDDGRHRGREDAPGHVGHHRRGRERRLGDRRSLSHHRDVKDLQATPVA